MRSKATVLNEIAVALQAGDRSMTSKSEGCHEHAEGIQFSFEERLSLISPCPSHAADCCDEVSLSSIGLRWP